MKLLYLVDGKPAYKFTSTGEPSDFIAIGHSNAQRLLQGKCPRKAVSKSLQGITLRKGN